jgi:hypothetical protein
MFKTVWVARFRNEAAYDATMASEAWQAVAADGENVFDMAWLNDWGRRTIRR